MKKRLPLIVLLAIAHLSVAQISPVYTARFQIILDSVCQKYKIKGASAAILIPTQGLWQGVYGESHAGVPITQDMYFRISSNTKVYTAATILKLQENGALSIDDTIGTWLPNVKNVNGKITIKQLLNHTSGIYNYSFNPSFSAVRDTDYYRVWQPEELFQYIEAPLWQPGGGYSYSNTNFILAGLIIQKVTNLSLHTVFRNLILGPQGLNETFLFPEQHSGTIPHGWSVMTSGTPMIDMQSTLGFDFPAPLSISFAAGGIVSTAEDNVRFWDKLIAGQIINSTSLVLMKDFIVKNPLKAGYGYGLGLQTEWLNARRGYSHGGANRGYLNDNFVDSASGVCFSILTNQDSIGLLQARVVGALHKATLQMPLGISEINKPQEIIIFPNPSIGALTINLYNHTSADLEITDITGRVVFVQPLQKGENNLNTGLSQGLFIVRIKHNGDLIQTQKIVIR